jgi:hypothetical protein
MSCRMSSGGSGLSRLKPQDKLLSSSSTALMLSYRPTSCGNPHMLKCTMKGGRRSEAVRARFYRRGSLHRSCSVSPIPAGDSVISRSQREGTVIQHRRLGPTSHPRRVRSTQAQLKVGRSVHHQAGYKTRVLSTTISQGPRCSELLEHSEPMQVLPIRKCSEIADFQALRWSLSSELIWRLRATRFGL